MFADDGRPAALHRHRQPRLRCAGYEAAAESAALKRIAGARPTGRRRPACSTQDACRPTFDLASALGLDHVAAEYSSAIVIGAAVERAPRERRGHLQPGRASVPEPRSSPRKSPEGASSPRDAGGARFADAGQAAGWTLGRADDEQRDRLLPGADALLLPGHVESMAALLDDEDLVHSQIGRHDAMPSWRPYLADLAGRSFANGSCGPMQRGRRGGTAHTVAA